MTILTPDGISHGTPEDQGRSSAFCLVTACGLEFRSWCYVGKRYGYHSLDKELPVIATGGVVDCMTCLTKRVA